MRYPDYLVHYNKNHDKRTGRFTFGDGNGDGVSPDDYRTPELDKTYSELEKSGVFKFNTIKPVGNTGDVEKEWGKEIVNATDVGIKALNKTRYKGEFNDYDLLDDVNKNGERHWFLFDDQTYGMPELAYLVNKGWSKDKIIDAFKTSSDLRDVNSKYEDDYLANKNVTFNDKNWYETYKEADKSSPYKGIWNLAEGYDRMDYSNELDKYIDACIEISKETKHSDMEYSEYLMHFNKNHDKKSGRFSFGDGDGDGIRDDHSNQSKKQSTSDGSKKTIVVAGPKNPRNPFSGREKTKIEVSDDVYKEFMKADTKRGIIRGSSNLVTGGLYLAAGILTENPVALGVGVAALVSSAANYVDSGTHFVNKIVDSVYKDKTVEEIDTLVKIDPTIFGKKYYDPNSKEITNLNLKQVRERNKSVGLI